MKKIVWALVASVVCLALGLGAGVMLGTGTWPSAFSSSSQEPTAGPSSYEEVLAVMPEEQIVLLSLGIEGLQERQQGQKEIFGWKVPGSERVMFVGYSFKAKLGVEGKDINIEQTGPDQFLITVPDFIFIGHDEIEFKSAIEQNGALAWTTPEIDQSEVTNEILNSESKSEYITEYEGQLQEQTINFFENLVESIDADVRLEFEFK